MPKSAKKKTAPEESSSPKVDPEMPFEEALERLEDLVQGMETDTIPLDELIENYEEGTALYTICEKRLDEARGRIEIIRKKRSGIVKLEDFDEHKGGNSKKAESSHVTSSETAGTDDVVDTEIEDGELF